MSPERAGNFYRFDRATGRILRRTDLAPFKRAPCCIISAFAPDGGERYRFTSEYPVEGYAAFVAGVGLHRTPPVARGVRFRHGRTLWSADLGDFSYASPIVVPSGVYAFTNAGDVHAFGLAEESLANAEPHG